MSGSGGLSRRLHRFSNPLIEALGLCGGGSDRCGVCVGVETNIEATGKKEKGLELKRLLACEPKQILLIGDTLHDHEVAEAIGCDCALITHGHNDVAQLQSANARLVHDMNAVFTLLAG